MKNCCYSATQKDYELFLKTWNYYDCASLLRGLKLMIDKRVPLVNLVLDKIDLRVVHSKPFVSAMARSCTCMDCQNNIPIVVISSSLLLFLWRLQVLLISMIEPVREEREGTQIIFRVPTDDDKQQLIQMLELYFGNEAQVNNNLWDLMDNTWEKLHNKSLLQIQDATILAEIWILLHEIAHIFILMGDIDDRNFWPFYDMLVKVAAREVEKFHLTPMIQHKWNEEFLADLMATSYLLHSVIDAENKVDISTDTMKFIGGLVLAGVSAAANSVNYIELSSVQYQKKSPKQRDCPPIVLRIDLMLRLVEGTIHSGQKPNGSIYRLAQAIGIVGSGLYEACRSSCPKV